MTDVIERPCSQAAIAASCFGAKHDAAAKEPILKALESGKVLAVLQGENGSYLERVATRADLPRIEAIAAKQSGFMRLEVEQVLAAIRLRQLPRLPSRG